LVLVEVLRHAYKKGYINIDEISRELEISKSLLEHIIRELKDKEYLKTATPLDEKAYCSFCPLVFKCHTKKAEVIKSYILTEKGRKLLRRQKRTF